MIITWVLVMLLATEPAPIFAFLSDHDTLKECEKAGKSMKIDDDDRERLGCMAISRDGI